MSQGSLGKILVDQHPGHLDDLEVPPLPAIAGRVLQLAADPQADARKLAALVERDPGLAATVLRVVRSPVWAGAAPITTLQQAIARLGLRPLTEIVVAASLRPAPSHGPNAPAITETWRHAVATASLARRVSAIRRVHVESAFLCGLLHSVGRLLLLRSERPVDPALLNEHHAAVGAEAARRWNFPPAVVAAIAHHADWAAASPHVEEAATTWLAARLANGDPDLEQDPVVERLTVYPDQLDALRAQLADVTLDLAALA